MLTADDLAFAERHAREWFSANTWPHDPIGEYSFAEYVRHETEANGALLDLSLRSVYGVWVELPEAVDAR